MFFYVESIVVIHGNVMEMGGKSPEFVGVIQWFSTRKMLFSRSLPPYSLDQAINLLVFLC